MEGATERYTRYVGKTRYYYYVREGAKKPYGLAFDSGKISWFASQSAVERIIDKRAKQNHEGKKTYNARIKEVIFTCACGCGETCTAPQKTRRPKYKDDTHRARARAARAEQKRIEADKRSRAAKRARNPKVKTEETQRKGKSSQRAGGVEGRGSERGEGASPLFERAQSTGLFADQPEPKKSRNRRNVGLPAVNNE